MVGLRLKASRVSICPGAKLARWKRPGSASTKAVTGTTYGYGVYDDSKTTWANADGYLPAMVTTFHRGGATIAITNFGDQVSIGGHEYVIVYSRVAVTNPAWASAFSSLATVACGNRVAIATAAAFSRRSGCVARWVATMTP